MKRKFSFCLILLLIIGFFLRIRNLGYYSLFASDDAITALSIKGILKYGYAVFPSGRPYFKELLFSFPTAWLCKVFGMNEFTLRVLNLPFSLGVILLTYLLGRQLLGKNAGLLSAAIMTFATWNLEFVRYVRSYSLIQFLFLLCIYLFFKAFVKEERVNKILLFSLFILTIFPSLLGVILVISFLSLWLIKGRHFFKLSTMLFNSLFIAIAIVWLQTFSFFHDPVELTLGGEHFSFVRILQRLPLPQFKIVFHLIKNFPILWYFMLSAYLISALYLIRRSLFNTTTNRPKHRYLLLFCLMTLILFDLPELGILIFCAYTIITRTKIKAFKDKTIIASLSILGLGTICWFLYGLFFWKGASFAEIKDLRLLYEIARHINLFKFPHLVYYLYFSIPFPRMSFIVAIGLSILYLNSIRNKDREKAIFLSSLFVGIILFLPFPWRHSHHRYNFPIYPLFILIYAFTIIKISCWISELPKLKRLFKNVVRAGALILFLIFTLEHANPFEAYHVVNVAYGEQVIHPYLASSDRVTHYLDYKSAGDYVRKHLGKDDIVIVAFERFVLFFYIGQVDYYIYFFEDPTTKETRFFLERQTPGSEPYIRCGSISNLNVLKEVLDKNIKQGRGVWIITTNYLRLKGPQRKLVNDWTTLYRDFFGFLKNNSQSLVYVAKDNLTEVYKFSP